MKKKSLMIIIVSGLVLISFLILGRQNLDETLLADTFTVSAVYFEDTHIVKISYQDKTNQTSAVTLEVIGLADSFQKKFYTSAFVEQILLANKPQYGWSSIPVTFLVEHEQFGKIQLKTEIRPPNEEPVGVIYSRP